MSAPDVIEDLERASRALERLPDTPARAVLTACIDELLHGRDPRARLGLPAVASYRLRLARRDYWLRQAYQLLPPAADRSRCEALETEASRFEAIVWPRWRDLAAPPSEASPLRACLFKARAAGEIPGWRQLFSICVMNRRSNCTSSRPP